MNKRRFTWFLMLLLIVTVAVSMWIWWSAQAGPYAYTVISEYDRLEGHMSHRIRSINSFAVTVDLGSGEVIDTFPIDIRVPMRIRLDPTGQELYVTGSEGHPEEISRDHWSAESPQWEDIHVYDVRTGKLARTIKLPEDADGSVRGMSITPDGNRLYISNPYENVEDAPTVEKQKRRWALDPQTGEFLFGFDVSPGTYLTNDGNKGYDLYGGKDGILGPGFTAIDIKNDMIVTAYHDFDRLMEEQGGLKIEGIEFGYPHMEDYRPMRFYDRDTYEQIGELDLRENFEADRKLGFSSRVPHAITNNKKYRVVGIRAETDSPNEYEYFLRWIDIQNMEIVDTIRIWEGSGRTLGPVAH